MATADERAQQGCDPEAARLGQALKVQLQAQIDRLIKLKGVKAESLAKVKAGPAVVNETS